MWARSFGRSYTNLSLHTFLLHPQVNFVQKLSITCRPWLLRWANLEPMVIMLLPNNLIVLLPRSNFKKSQRTTSLIPYLVLGISNLGTRFFLRGGRLWRPRFLITVIIANDRISRVKPAEHRSNLGQPGSSPQKPRQWTLLDPLTKSTSIRGQPLVRDPIKPRLRIDVGECRPELLPRSPKFN
jgi:hypothetical protein